MNNNEQNTLIAIQEKVSRLLSIDLHPQQVDLDLHWIQKFAPNINLKILLPKTLNDAISLLSSDSNLYKVLGVYQLPQLYSHAPNALKYKETINLHRLVSNVPCSFLLGPRQSHNLKSSFAREIISFQPEIFIKICKFSHWELASIVQTIEVLDDQTQQLFLSYPEVQCIFETKALNMQ
ncbi:hypothetical protein SS50377_23671 [Spironucleus salmonicida]|nr:hypothetical protein SS50377_23671 [Spironucleus salmonicida]